MWRIKRDPNRRPFLQIIQNHLNDGEVRQAEEMVRIAKESELVSEETCREAMERINEVRETLKNWGIIK